MTTATESAPASARRRRGPGRPRHADTEPRAYAAALAIFGRRGWAGLTLDGVAGEAGIGKSSIYLRWSGKRELLTEAIEHLAAQHPTPDTSGMGLSEHLVVHAQARAELYLGEYGPAMIELYAAAAGAPEDFADLCLRDVSRGMHGSAPRVRQAIDDGELARAPMWSPSSTPSKAASWSMPWWRVHEGIISGRAPSRNTSCTNSSKASVPDSFCRPGTRWCEQGLVVAG